MQAINSNKYLYKCKPSLIVGMFTLSFCPAPFHLPLHTPDSGEIPLLCFLFVSSDTKIQQIVLKQKKMNYTIILFIMNQSFSKMKFAQFAIGGYFWTYLNTFSIFHQCYSWQLLRHRIHLETEFLCNSLVSPDVH